MRASVRHCTAAGCLASILGCVSPTETPPPKPEVRAEAEAVRPKRPTFVPARDATDVPTAVLEARREAEREGQRIVVYVGASWCEPCRLFHDAIERGEVGAEIADVRFLEFDADTDTEALTEAGYGGRMIPRFAVPGPDGRSTGIQIEGGIKGEGAVEHIMQRLVPMLARSRPAPSGK